MIRQNRQSAISQSPLSLRELSSGRQHGVRFISREETYHPSLQRFVKKSIFNRVAPETPIPPESPSRGPERLRARGCRPALVPAPTSLLRGSRTLQLWPSGTASACVRPIQRPLSAR